LNTFILKKEKNMTMVPLDITVREVPNSLAIESKIRQKTDKLVQHCNKMEFCKVVVGLVQKQKHQGKLYDTHIEVGVPGKRLVVTRKKDEDLYVAVRDAFKAMDRQVKRYADEQHGDVKKHVEQLFGYVARKFEDYGFIETPEGIEYYFNASNVMHKDFDLLEVGEQVVFLDTGAENSDTMQACHVIG